jgi:hypothetical protein
MTLSPLVYDSQVGGLRIVVPAEFISSSPTTSEG